MLIEFSFYQLLNLFIIQLYSFLPPPPQSYQGDHSGESSHRSEYWLLMWLASFLGISIKPVKDSALIL